MVEMIGVLKQEQEESMVESQEERAKVDSHEEKAEKVKKRRKRVYDPHRKRACVDCTKRCVRVHGRASSVKARPIPTLPSFFKIMMGYFSENMDIPPPFAKTILDLTDSNIYLEDAFGLRWRVQLCLRDGFLSFGHGWKNFVLDHAISVGEFLVFRQIARTVFTVQIFAPSACERMYLCERNKRQSRKRKPRKKTSSPSNQTAKISKNNSDSSKKKQRTYLPNDPGPSDCDLSVHVCIDTETPKATSELRCSQTSERAPGTGAAKSHEVDEVPTRDQDKAQDVLDGETETADDCTTCKEKETECNAIIREHPIYDATGSKTLESMVVIDVSSNTKDMTVDANKSEAYQDLSYSVASNIMMADKGMVRSHQDRPNQLHCALGLEGENTEVENCGGSNFQTNAEIRTPLAMMDLNEVIMDDIFLSADVYEFESDFGNPEAFSVELNMEGLTTKGQTSGCSCAEISLPNCDSSMGVGHCLGLPETSSCLENKEMTDAQVTSTDAGNVPVNHIDINALPSYGLSAFGDDNSSPDIDAEVPSSECAINICKKNKDNLLLSPESNQVEQKEGFVPADCSGKQDNLQDGPGQIAAEIMSASPKPRHLTDLRQNLIHPGNTYLLPVYGDSPRYPRFKSLVLDACVHSQMDYIKGSLMSARQYAGNNCEGLESGSTESGGVLKANNKKFCIAVPPSDQTWLEFPSRLPVLPRTKKQGRKILILKDPCMRLWPVLYQCTPRFNGFITGWADISRENNLREGDTCEFELCGNSELSFQVRMPNLQQSLLPSKMVKTDNNICYLP